VTEQPAKDWQRDYAWYTPPRVDWPAAVRLEGRADLVLRNEQLRGDDQAGFGILLIGCQRIRISGGSIQGFYYGIYAVDCEEITIADDCDLRFNFARPETGWLVSDDPRYQGDLDGWGGGLYFRNVLGGRIEGNQIGNQFNGLDLVECREVTVVSNDVAHTSNYAIHLWGSQDCVIQDNDCRWTIRSTPLFPRDTADSAAVLLEGGSCRNQVLRNDLRWSGDGLFVRDLAQGAQSSDDNYLANNDCSHSPNNAIEVVFSRGNVIEANDASFSNYGLWLDYSQDLAVRDNRVEHNGSEGIHVRSGSFKELARNRILGNPVGLNLIETAAPEAISSNVFQNNTRDLIS
jgi:parallel beta-helix repeat protein